MKIREKRTRENNVGNGEVGRVNLGRKKQLGSRKIGTCKGIKKPKIMQTSIRGYELIEIHFYMDAEMALSLPVDNKHIL